jgi:NADH dehydrogenase
VPPVLGYWVGWIAGKLVGDTVVTREEIAGLMHDLLVTDSPPAGATKLTDWAREHAATLGVKHANELARRRDRQGAYEKL